MSGEDPAGIFDAGVTVENCPICNKVDRVKFFADYCGECVEVQIACERCGFFLNEAGVSLDREQAHALIRRLETRWNALYERARLSWKREFEGSNERNNRDKFLRV